MSSDQQEADDNTEEQHPVERKGEWTVDVVEASTGYQRLDHGANTRVILMGLPMHSGWKAFEHLHLPHQTRVGKVKNWIAEHPNAREVAVLEVDKGIWHTVWVKNRHEPVAGNNLRDTSDKEIATSEFADTIARKDWFTGDDYLLVSEDSENPVYWATGTESPPDPHSRMKAGNDGDVSVGEVFETSEHGSLIPLHDARE